MKLNVFFITIPLISCTLFFNSNNIFAQGTASDSSFYQKALVNTMAVYHQSFGDQSALYNGSRYGEYLYKFKEGDPYFYSPAPVAGTVIYDGIKYDNILMRYDEIRDELIINDQGNRIQLLKEKVQYFNLYTADFIHIKKDSLVNNFISSGFYNLLYKGKICLLKKEIKTSRDELSIGTELQISIERNDYYYIKKDNKFYPIKNKGNLFNVFEDKKSEVQQFIKANDLSFKRDRQNMLTKTTAYYDSLKK